MGDYSRDTFALTNIMHQVHSGAVVSDARHYVGVRLQQAVPLLDADWNERDDIHRLDQQLQLQHFFGDGIPSGNDGFRIGPVTEDNNFAVHIGMALVSGMLVFNEQTDLTYLGQATVFELTVPALAAPLVGERTDLVYLDVWHEEMGPSGISRMDERLTNPAIGIETCYRLERRWQVRVAEGSTALDSITSEAGHAYMALALLHREAGQPRIFATAMEDLRRVDVNVSRYLKIPLYVTHGSGFVDSTRFAESLEALNNILLLRLEEEIIFFGGIGDHARALLHFALQQVLYTCTTGALQARTHNLTNRDALEVFQRLALAQSTFVARLTTYGTASVAKDAFVAQYSAPLLANLTAALTNANLYGAYQQQQAINAWLSEDVNALPEGVVNLQFAAVTPAEPLVAGTPYTFFIEIISGVSSDQGEEIFDAVADLSSDLWQLTPGSASITLDNVGGTSSTGVLQFTVTPNAANLLSDFSVIVSARRNPTIVSSALPLPLQIGVEPLTGGVLQYAGPPLNLAGRLEISAASLTSGFGNSISFAFNNNTINVHTYTVEWFISLSVGDETGWTPLNALPSSNSIVVAAESAANLGLNIAGPTGGDVVGNLGILTVRLIEIDGAPLAPGEIETVSVTFEAV